MQHFSLILLTLFLTPTTLLAQEPRKEPTTTTPPKLIIGGTIGLAESQYQYRGIAVAGPSVGLFARNYFGKHFALESGIKYNAPGPLTVTSTDFVGTRRFTTRSVSVPVHLQYHLLTSNSRIRPYFGIGVGLARRYNHTVYIDASGKETESMLVYNDGFIQFTQGFTWQISKNLQLNQAFYYQQNRSGNLGFELGLGYTIR